ncbi:hypothetical protein KAZ66_03535 [Candidatus Woesebacteria bacterium]|nr:hypothetical protein [Candidatus Woesebacteria bacterium]
MYASLLTLKKFTTLVNKPIYVLTLEELLAYAMRAQVTGPTLTVKDKMLYLKVQTSGHLYVFCRHLDALTPEQTEHINQVYWLLVSSIQDEDTLV